MAKATNRNSGPPTRETHEEPVRAHTPSEINDRLDRETDIRVQYYGTQGEEVMARRIKELEEETDIEHVLEANAASLTLLGLVMGVAFSRKWLLLPVVTGAFLLNHAIRGWCPPVSVFRRMGVRTQEEIDREKYSLMALRGDFDETRKRLRGK